MDESKKNPPPGLVIAAFAAVYTIWGSTYTAIAVAVQTFPPFVLAFLRFFGAGLALLAWCLARREKIPRLRSLFNCGLSGILMLGCGTTTLIWAEQYLPSGITAIIGAAIPLWFVVLDKRQWSANLSNRQTILGLIFGFGGILLLSGGTGPMDLVHNRLQLISFIALALGGVVWVAGSLYSKYSFSEGSTPMKVAIQMIAAGFATLVTAAITGEITRFSPNRVSGAAIFSLLYLIIMGSLVGFIAYTWLLGVRSAALVGTYAYVNPAIALILGWIIIGEKVGWLQVLALVTVLGGVALVNLSAYRKAVRAR